MTPEALQELKTLLEKAQGEAAVHPPHGLGTVFCEQCYRAAMARDDVRNFMFNHAAELIAVVEDQQKLAEALEELEKAGWPCRLVEAPAMITQLGIELTQLREERDSLKQQLQERAAINAVVGDCQHHG